MRLSRAAVARLGRVLRDEFSREILERVAPDGGSGRGAGDGDPGDAFDRLDGKTVDNVLGALVRERSAPA